MKPVVHYREEFYPNLQIGHRTIVTPVDHPKCSNTKPVVTSFVVRIGSWGEFETENTIYRPVKPINHDD